MSDVQLEPDHIRDGFGQCAPHCWCWGRTQPAEMLRAHIEHMEDQLNNEKFERALNRRCAEVAGQVYDDGDETPMPHIRVFEDEIIALRAIVTGLCASLPDGSLPGLTVASPAPNAEGIATSAESRAESTAVVRSGASQKQARCPRCGAPLRAYEPHTCHPWKRK